MQVYKIAGNNHFDGIGEMMEGIKSSEFTYVEPPKPYSDYLFDGVEWVLISSLPTQVNLSSLVNVPELVQSIDSKAEEIRASFITVGVLQQQIYDAKLLDAKAYIAASYPTTAAKKKLFPLIQQESLALGNTMKVVADSIVATYNGWMIIAGKIEGIRLKAKADISNTPDVATVSSITAQAISDLEALVV